MRAISIRQPRIEAILRGKKIIEYRSRPTKVRGRIYLYASLGRYGDEHEADMLSQYEIRNLTAGELPRGVLVGTVELYDCTEGDGEYHWHLRKPERAKRLVKPTIHPQPVWFKPF